MSKKNDSAFETNSDGSAFETESNGSAFETGSEGSAFETNDGGSSFESEENAETSNDSGVFVLTDDTKKTYALRDEVQLKDQGAMGCVSSAIWMEGRSEKKVLLKRLYKPVNSNQEKLFSNEGFMSKDYGGGSIVKLYGKGETEEFLFMIMEFYEGQTLDKLIDQGMYQGKIQASFKLVRDVLSALRELHGSEVVHRDFKPANIIIRKNGKPVILDLGLACQPGLSDVAGLKKIGTPKYAAPEQLKGKFSCASDIYSVGKIFLEMYTGEIDDSQVNSIPMPYRDFVKKCLNDNPNERYANAEEALDALNAMSMMGNSTIITTDNAEKLKIEIAKKYGDDGILDEQEQQELRSMARMWNISEQDLDVFINSAYNDIRKFRENYIVGCVLGKKGCSKQSVMNRAKKLYIDPIVVEEWLEEARDAINSQPSEESNEAVEEAECVESVVAPSKPKKKKKGCCGCLVLFVLIFVLLALFIDKIEDYLIYNGFEYGEMTDSRDGQKYRTREIGGVVWMAENMRFVTSGSWCEKCERYGRLYTWDDAVSVCPDGWTLPTADQWIDLFEAAGSIEKAGKNLKASYKWDNDGNGVNTVGFAALPAGFYSVNDAAVKNQGTFARWWTYTAESLERAVRVRIDGDSANVRLDPIATGYGLSVRCVYVDQKNVRKLEGPQLLNSRDEEHLSGKLESFTQNGYPMIRKPKARRPDTLMGVGYVDDIVPMLFKDASVDFVRLYDRSFVKNQSGVWDTLRYWVYDSLSVVGQLDAYETEELEGSQCIVTFDGLLPNGDRARIKMDTACANIYVGMPYKIVAKFLYRIAGEDYCDDCPPILLNYKELKVTLSESDERMVDARNGNIYPLVKIGKQVWMAKNLHYRGEDTPATCYENESDCEEQGFLYDYASAKTACPAGFRLPSNSDWTELTQTLGAGAGTKMKTSTYWQDGYEGNNASGFTALPAGYYQAEEGVRNFFLVGEYAGWWSSTPESDEKAFVENLIRTQPAGLSAENKSDGYSVRCIKEK